MTTSPKRGVIYYNRGTKCRVRLLVSLFSLRRYYTGPVAALCDSGLDDWFVRELRRLDCDVIDIPPLDGSALVAKASLWRHSPFETTLFLDADTLPVADPSPLFDVIEKHTFMTYHFAGWKTDRGKVGRRITAWEPAIGTKRVHAALKLGKAVNTGIHGYTNYAPILVPWEQLTRKGYELGCTTRLVDELACQVLLPEHPHKIVGPEWGASVKFGDFKSAKIHHYHGNKHCRGELPAELAWKAAYWEYRCGSPEYAEIGRPRGDRQFAYWMDTNPRPGVTLVTACDARYESKLKRNLPAWMADPALSSLPVIVFAQGIRTRWLKAYPNVTVIPWTFPAAGDNHREEMLSAFVYGVAKDVTTPFWFKLDADAKPTGTPWEWPATWDFAIRGHKWGYTRVKGDPGATVHWLNTLDDEMRNHLYPFPADIPVSSRHGHPRINSFCCIEQTAHTRAIVELWPKRLPVPSQDTTSWYVAHRLGKKIDRVKMKGWFTQ